MKEDVELNLIDRWGNFVVQGLKIWCFPIAHAYGFQLPLSDIILHHFPSGIATKKWKPGEMDEHEVNVASVQLFKVTVKKILRQRCAKACGKFGSNKNIFTGNTIFCEN